MLEVGPAVAIDCGHIEAVPRGDERGFLASEGIDLGRGIDGLMPAKVCVLRTLHGGRKHDLHESIGHRDSG